MELIQLKRVNTINKDICNNCKNMNKHCAGVNIPSMICTNCISICLDNLGYRKQSEVAKEIINKLQKINEEEIKTGNVLNFSARRLLILLIEKLSKEYGVEL